MENSMQFYEAYAILTNPACYSGKQVDEAKELIKRVKIDIELLEENLKSFDISL